MHTTRSLVSALGLAAALLVGGVACSAEDATNAALENAGVDANVSTGGDLPDGFPSDVATPDLELETGAAVEGTYTLRYTSDDATADIAAYRTALADAGFTPGEDFTFDKASGDHTGFTAASPEFNVMAAAYGPDAPGGGNYMAVVVTPV
jgi:hypothetical protein